jgi:hypothetical protein
VRTQENIPRASIPSLLFQNKGNDDSDQAKEHNHQDKEIVSLAVITQERDEKPGN